MTVLIAGGGIAGMTMALTCHQLGIPVKLFESVPKIQPLGVGINLQPNAVRELYDLGLSEMLQSVGLQAEEWALFATGGKVVWAEPRGLKAGYKWPQYSVHRGHLQMALLSAVESKIGAANVVTNAKLVRYENNKQQVRAWFKTGKGDQTSVSGSILVGADGMHSCTRAQMHPQQPPPHWGGAIMWRGTSQGIPCRTTNSFVLIGSLNQRFVCYPISPPNPKTGLSTINWIAELTRTSGYGDQPSDWNRQASLDDFIGEFETWQYDWLNVPKLIRQTNQVYEYPMVDRDPLEHWVDGRTALIGDAAHVMYPVGSNGASQAIVDARILGAKLSTFGLNQQALVAYQEQLLAPINELVLRNRGAGPIGILGIIDERSKGASLAGTLENVHDVIDASEIEEFMQRYKKAAGFAVQELNDSPPTINI